MNKKQKKVLRRILISAALCVIIFILPVNESIKGILFLAPYLICGYDILKKAYKGIMHRQPFDENFLMAVATIGAYCLKEYREAAAVMLFYQVGELFQSTALSKSRQSISDLMDIRPDRANILSEDGTLTEADPFEVEPGTIIVVKPGEKIPIDGIIVSGSTTLDQAALTGESRPAAKKAGDAVLSGAVNISGLINVKTTKAFEESTASKILELVENAGSRKSHTENFITRFARYYTPAVCGAALLLVTVPPFASMLAGRPANFSSWLYRGLTFLVISCPCALLISIPLTFFASAGAAGSRGILIKGSNFLEALSKIKRVVFDKTGTLTEGVFEVTDYLNLKVSKEELLRYAALAEFSSSHPAAISIMKAYGGTVDLALIDDYREIAGQGVCALSGGSRICAGNDKLMQAYKISAPQPGKAGTIVHIAKDGEFLGTILISDKIKAGSLKCINGLKAAGIKETVMLTGDTEDTARETAAALNIDRVMSGLLPQDKVLKVEELLNDNEKLAFLGDGINDAPVLKRADVGIAMGALGSDAAIEAADVVLMDDDPAKLLTAMHISKKCMRIVYENIIFTISVKVLCLLFTAAGKASMWTGIFADVGVMVIAVLNAVRALKVREE